MQNFDFAPIARFAVALAKWPFVWAQGLLRDRTPAFGPGAGFDFLRTQYAAAVQAGVIERSLLASGAFERRLGVLERLTLGPWARRV